MKNGNKIFFAFLFMLFGAATTLLGYYVAQKGGPETDTINAGYSIIPAAQRQRVNDEITQSRSNSITETVKKSSPAIVGINVTEIRQYSPFGSFWGDDPYMKQFLGTVPVEVKSLGSGSIISNDGYILTNDHVAGNATEIVVTLTNGEHYKAQVIGSDPVSDICLLKIDGNNFPYINFGNSDDVLIGEWAIALGNPFGLFEVNDQPTVTVGVISAMGMNLDPVNNRYYLNMLQTDAAINSGNSGGPLVNSVGEMIGINTLIYSASGGNVGLGFAIPINKAKKIVAELKAKGNIDRNFWTGIANARTIDENLAAKYNFPVSTGVLLTQIQRNSPAGRAGLEAGDIILSVNDYKVSNFQSFIGVLQEYRTGDIVSLSILRDKEKLIKKLTLEKRND